MSNHQKRLAVPDSWPVERKEATYTTKAGAGPHGEGGVPLLIVLRDVLGYVDSTKEARFALGQDSVLVNGRAVSDERRPIGMFDILTFREREEHYRVFPDEGGRLSLTPIDPDAAGSKLGKIEGKLQVPGGDTQLTLHDGQTLLVDEVDQYGANDSIVVSNEDSEERSSSDDASGQGPRADEVVAHFPYEEGALVTAVRGAHAGRIGTIDEIQVTPGSSANNVLIEDVHGEADFETVEEYVVVIDENFVEGADADDATEPAVEDEADADEDVDDSEAEAEDDYEAEADEDVDDSEAEAEDDSEAEADEDVDDSEAEADEDVDDSEVEAEEDSEAEAEEDSEADADEAEEDSETEPDEDVDDSEADQADAEDDGGDDE
jgi:small subunit ribosomal protein S4e